MKVAAAVRNLWMTRHSLIPWLKFLALTLILTAVGWNLFAAWHRVDVARLKATFAFDWRWAMLSLFGCAGVILTGASVWMYLLRKLDCSGPRLRLYAAYCFSQLGKYVPGKVMLVLMRVERTSGMGVSSRATTVSTILENVTYMASAAAAGVLILVRFAFLHGPKDHLWLLVISFAALLGVLTSMHPGVFYRVLNAVLRKLGRPEIDPQNRFRTPDLLAAVILMTPCWLFGGIALWATTRSLIPVGPEHYSDFVSAFALSVLLGMLSMIPGGLGAREVVQGMLLLPVVTMGNPSPDAQAEAKLMVTMVVVLQRIVQISAEVILGLLGGWLTALPVAARGRRAPPENSATADRR